MKRLKYIGLIIAFCLTMTILFIYLVKSVISSEGLGIIGLQVFFVVLFQCLVTYLAINNWKRLIIEDKKNDISHEFRFPYYVNTYDEIQDLIDNGSAHSYHVVHVLDTDSWYYIDREMIIRKMAGSESSHGGA